ncbi:sirohydrochlorin cobaltochelatase [Vibrio sp. 10N.222.51.C12]|uniref:sirohydrochlorin cobaltochelatase n=1 Tax=unclassified Vibrio TaxID=2614977 RepID=UPI000C846F8D|nr:sirohydrochlorin cobaltochelatase [Vibrio sp. 10N.286.48.B7]PMH77704.1 cobalt chelatase [Vibrio sp. 10N.286.48.B7]
MKRLRHYNKSTSIVLSCFGSVVEQQRYVSLHHAVQARYPNCEVRLAVTSRMVIKKLAKQGQKFEHLPSVLASLDMEGYQRILVVSCYLFPTDEHKQLTQVVKGFRQFSLSHIEYTPAIIHHTQLATDLVGAIDERFTTGSDVNVFVHHGAPYLDNPGHQAITYCGEFLSKLSDKNICCSLEGAMPFHLIKNRLQRSLIESSSRAKLRLIPLLLVSGNHFINDMHRIKADFEGLCDVEFAKSDDGTSFNLLSLPEVTDVIFKQIDQGLIRLRAPEKEI